MNPALETYLKARSAGGVALAFSGGVDSTLLLAVLLKLRGERPFPLLALTAASIFQTAGEIETARHTATAFQVEHEVLEFDPLALSELEFNPPDRCYRCKRAIFRMFLDRAAAHGIAHVIDGTNADDLRVYRPGRRALTELGVLSPLAELGITKREVRALAAELGLACAGKPAAPCLATRFPYGTRLTAEAIRRAANGEKILRELFPEASNLRLRLHGDLARIELPAELLPLATERHEKTAAALKKLGCRYITLDLEGFRSGSMDEVIPK